MICVPQRVTRASVRVGERTLGAIAHGLPALVAVVPKDDESDVARLADRLVTPRVFADAAGRMNLSVEDAGGALLLVSPCVRVMDGVPLHTGEFGAAMAVELVNDGPVTLSIDSAGRRDGR